MKTITIVIDESGWIELTNSGDIPLELSVSMLESAITKLEWCKKLTVRLMEMLPDHAE